MNTDYQYHHSLGSLYTAPGHIQFHPSDSSKLLAPTSNRVTTYELTNQSTYSTQYGHRQSIYTWAINNQGNLLVTCSIHGSISFLSYPQGVILRREKEGFFPKKVRSIVFSQDDRYMIVMGGGSKLSIWATGLLSSNNNSNHQQTHNNINHHIPKPTFVCSLTDSYFTVCKFGQRNEKNGNYPVLLGTREGSLFLYNFEASNYDFSEKSYQCNASKNPIVHATFETIKNRINPGQLHALDDTGVYVQFKFDTTLKTYELIHKQRLPFLIQDHNKQMRVTSACELNCGGSSNKTLLAIGTSTDRFALFSYQFSAASMNCICDEKISSKRLVETEHKKGPNAYNPTLVSLNHTGEWIAVTNVSHLLVYDYASKTFITRQSAHHSRQVHRVTYNPEGTLLATADTYGTVKVYDAKRHQCFVTLEAHKGAVNAMIFSRPPSSRDPALYTASSDGTVRAWDVVRYRNFRTYVPNREGVSFQCLAVDSSGEIIVASSFQAPFHIYMWNAQTAQLISELTSHSGPITGLSFSSHHQLASCSWDNTARVWDVFGKGAPCEVIDHEREVTCLAYSPAAQGTLVTGDIQGVLRFWDINAENTGNLLVEIETARDWGADKDKEGVVLSNIKWTPDGQCVLVSAKNKSFVHMYHVEQKVLLKRFQVCTNVAFANVPDPESFYLDRTKLINDDDANVHMSVDEIAMCPTDHEFVAATPDGAVIYRSSQSVLTDNRNLSFIPLGIDETVTPQTIYGLLREGKVIDALLMSLRLNERTVTQRVLYTMLQNSPESSNSNEMDAVVLLWTRNIPQEFVIGFLDFLCGELEDYQYCTNVQYILLWIKSMLTTHGQFLLQAFKTQSSVGTCMRRIVRGLNEFDHNGLNNVSTQNTFTLQYLRTFRPGVTSKIGKDKPQN